MTLHQILSAQADNVEGAARYGNPPKNPPVLKVEISMKEFLHDKEQTHGQPDHGCNKAS